MDKRGPKLGDAASLWNFTPSPGWTKEESLTLKLCLLKFGIGQWVQIQATGLLPGKLIQQLCGATQRLCGQQSLAAFSGLRVDIDRIRADNAAKTDAKRKSGLIIWSGANPTKEMRLQWQQEAREKYGLSPEQQAEAEAAYAQMVAASAAACVSATEQEQLPADCDILGCDTSQLGTCQKQQLLCLLHKRLQQLLLAVCAQHPQLQPDPTFMQQEPRGWLALGVPLQQSQRVGSTDHTTGNMPSRAMLGARQASAAAAAVSRSKGGSGSGSKRGNQERSGRPPTGRSKGSAAGRHKRARKAAAGQHDAGVGHDDDDDFMDPQTSRARSLRSCGSNGGSNGSSDDGSGMLKDLMNVALEAGVAQLVEMGYSRRKALDALTECNCDVEMAVEYLTAACC